MEEVSIAEDPLTLIIAQDHSDWRTSCHGSIGHQRAQVHGMLEEVELFEIIITIFY